LLKPFKLEPSTPKGFLIMIKVFYDGKCGMCSKEINHYKKIAPKNRFEWIDITKSPERLSEIKLNFQEAMKSFHVLDEQKNLHIGIEAFKQIWNEIPRWKSLSLFVDLPGIRFLTRKAYRFFADWRFRHHGYDQCQIN
jgi:predicted DCC family thiol-disulfide oxidoreductase YuxK